MLAAVTRATHGNDDIATRISAAEAEFEDAHADFQLLFKLLRPEVVDERTLIAFACTTSGYGAVTPRLVPHAGPAH